MSIFRVKKLSDVKEASNSGGLKKTLTAFDLIVLGIGAVIGTGIFVITGPASQLSGPALPISFLLSGLICMFVALVYTEIGSMIPTSGSVYTYSYVAIGEFMAWISSMIIICEFTIGAATVAAGWSGYVVQIAHTAGFEIPKKFAIDTASGGFANIPAILISLLITFVNVRGTKESTLLNNILVVVKMAAIALFVGIAFPHVNIEENWKNFSPFGFEGISAGAAIIFLAFAGFDSLATTAEECKNPKRDLTIGIIGSLVVCTLVYMIVSGVLTAIVPYQELNNSKPLAHALSVNGSNIGSALVAAGGVAGMTTVLIVNIFAQSRIFFSMARDGLIPKIFSKVHKKYGTPYISTLFSGLIVALLSGFLPVKTIAGLASMGTLAVFLIASILVVILRIKMPDVERPFKCPIVYLISTISIISCAYLIIELIPIVGMNFAYFLGISSIFYFLYSYRNSTLKNQ